MTAWHAYIDPSNKGKIAKMAVVETTEPDGIEIVVPIKANDVSKTHEKAIFLFGFAKVMPEFINLSFDDKEVIEAQKTEKPVFQGEGWRFMGKGILCRNG